MDISKPSPVADQFAKITYADLNGKQKEIFNFQKVAAVLADYGFQCLLLADDWNGADFLAYQMLSGVTVKIQLKGRVTIKRDYLGKDLWIACPAGWVANDAWLVIPHDTLVDEIRAVTPTFEQSDSWTGPHGAWSMKVPNKSLQQHVVKWVLEPI